MLAAADYTQARCNYGGVTLVSDKSFTVAGGANTTALSHLAALGLQEGTYGGSNNGIKIRDLNISTVTGANDALGAVDAALGQISDMRSNLGAIQNRLQSAIENLTSSQTNMQQSVSRIADTDYGTATTQMSRAQIINQAATAMLAQANQQSQLVLQLLK
jgi:flagellin